MINLDETLYIHKTLIEEFGGRLGIRNQQALNHAISRPYTTFGKEDLYPSPQEKAATAIESIIMNHPFKDGNKRTGYAIMVLILMDYGYDINCSDKEKYQFLIDVAAGKLDLEEIKSWIENFLVEL